MRIRTASLVAILAVAALAACNTVEGVGRDTSAAGRSLSNAADQGSRDIHTGNAPECANGLHQDRPGGTDYRGPRDAACEPQRARTY
jgi:predicted small secreted protein